MKKQFAQKIKTAFFIAATVLFTMNGSADDAVKKSNAFFRPIVGAPEAYVGALFTGVIVVLKAEISWLKSQLETQGLELPKDFQGKTYPITVTLARQDLPRRLTVNDQNFQLEDQIEEVRKLASNSGRDQKEMIREIRNVPLNSYYEIVIGVSGVRVKGDSTGLPVSTIIKAILDYDHELFAKIDVYELGLRMEARGVPKEDWTNSELEFQFDGKTQFGYSGMRRSSNLPQLTPEQTKLLSTLTPLPIYSTVKENQRQRPVYSMIFFPEIETSSRIDNGYGTLNLVDAALTIGPFFDGIVSAKNRKPGNYVLIGGEKVPWIFLHRGPSGDRAKSPDELFTTNLTQFGADNFRLISRHRSNAPKAFIPYGAPAAAVFEPVIPLPLKNQSILVIGGAGSVGTDIVEHFAIQGYQVVVIGRKQLPDAGFLRLQERLSDRISYTSSDFDRAVELVPFLKGQSAIVHAAEAYPISDSEIQGAVNSMRNFFELLIREKLTDIPIFTIGSAAELSLGAFSERRSMTMSNLMKLNGLIQALPYFKTKLRLKELTESYMDRFKMLNRLILPKVAGSNSDLYFRPEAKEGTLFFGPIYNYESPVVTGKKVSEFIETLLSQKGKGQTYYLAGSLRGAADSIQNVMRAAGQENGPTGFSPELIEGAMQTQMQLAVLSSASVEAAPRESASAGLLVALQLVLPNPALNVSKEAQNAFQAGYVKPTADEVILAERNLGAVLRQTGYFVGDVRPEVGARPENNAKMPFKRNQAKSSTAKFCHSLY